MVLVHSLVIPECSLLGCSRRHNSHNSSGTVLSRRRYLHIGCILAFSQYPVELGVHACCCVEVEFQLCCIVDVGGTDTPKITQYRYRKLSFSLEKIIQTILDTKEDWFVDTYIFIITNTQDKDVIIYDYYCHWVLSHY